MYSELKVESPSGGEDETSKPHPIRFGMYGLVNLLTYSIIYSLLPNIKDILAADIESYASIGYGLAAAGGQVMGILISRKVRVNHFIPITYFAMCLPTIAFGLLMWIPESMNLKVAVVAMWFLGIIGAAQQLFVSGAAAASSISALLSFYVGQSISGVIAFPIVLGITKMLNRWAPEAGTRYMILTAACICIFMCVAMGFLYLSNHGSMGSVDVAKEMGSLGFIWSVFRSIQSIAFSVMFVTFVSFAVYPRDILSWSPGLDSMFSDRPFYQSFLIYVAIASDVAGMLVTMWLYNFNIRSVPWISAFRVLFIFLFWFAGWDSFANDWLRFPLVILMSLSGAMAFGSAVNGASSLVELHAQYAMGQLMSLSFSLGIALGGVCSHYLGNWLSKL